MQSFMTKFESNLKPILPLSFFPESGGNENDFDIGLLSEYLFDEDKQFHSQSGSMHSNDVSDEEDDDGDGNE